MPILGWTSIGLGVLLALSLAFGFYEKANYETCQASIAKEAALAEQHVNDAKAADAKTTQALAQQAETFKAAVQEKVNGINVSLAKAASVPSCGHTAASDAFDDGLRIVNPNTQVNQPRPGAAKPNKLP